jgi:hypothetical protein
MAKLGMREEGVMRENIFTRGRQSNVRSSSEWNGNKGQPSKFLRKASLSHPRLRSISLFYACPLSACRCGVVVACPPQRS